jgi:dTMP kinase
MTPPRYIALEGSEGCGKSTQAELLARSLGAVLTQETGGTPVGQRLRSILHDVAVTDLDDRAEALIIAADRAQHMRHVVQPALDAGSTVVSDRSVYSSVAYQGYGRGLDLAAIRRINDWALAGRWPDVVVLLDAPVEHLEERLGRRRLDRFERETSEFHERVRDGFRTMAAAEPDRWVVVDGDGTIDEVAAAILSSVKARLS